MDVAERQKSTSFARTQTPNPALPSQPTLLSADALFDREPHSIEGVSIAFDEPFGGSGTGGACGQGSSPDKNAFDALRVPQKPTRVVVRNRKGIDTFGSTFSLAPSGWNNDHVLGGFNVPSHPELQSLFPNPVKGTNRFYNDHSATSESITHNNSTVKHEPRTCASSLFPRAAIQSQISVQTFPSIPVVAKHDLPQSSTTCHYQHPLPSPPATVERYYNGSSSTPLFLSTEAEEYWKTFGPIDPISLGHVLLQMDAPQKWLTACFAVAHPYAHELMRQLDTLSAEVATVLSPHNSSYKSIFQIDYRVGRLYDAEWRSRFESFCRYGWSNNWDSRVKKLYLLKDEYRSTTNKLYDHWGAISFVPKHVWDRLKRLDTLREALQDNLPSMSELIERGEILRRDDQQRREEHERERERELKLEQDRLATTNTKSSRIPCLWKGSTKTSVKKENKHVRNLQSRSTGLCDLLTGWKEDCIASFSSLRHLSTYGTQRAAYVIVSCLSALATAAMALSVWRCPPTAALSISITIDSNFWSTCSQMFTGLGGLYCLIIPILQHTDLDVSTPRLFKGLLILSFVAAVVAVFVYHFQTQVSLIVALVSGLAGLLATLMVIKDAGNKITTQSYAIDSLEGEITRLRNR